MSENDLQFDELKMYFGDDFWVTDKICIHQPTIGEIIEFGEERMYASIMPFTCNTTTYRLQLWKNGIDWNKITDYEMFCMFLGSLKPEDTKLVFGDFDFTTLTLCKNNETEEIGFYDEEFNLIIDELVYMRMSEYLRLMFNQHPKVEKAKGKLTKQALIEEDEMKIKIAQRKGETSHSTLLPLISALLNHPGFKYKKNELREVGIVEFMDSVQRLQIYENTRALMSGMYSGMLDTSKIDTKTELNWLRDLRTGK